MKNLVLSDGFNLFEDGFGLKLKQEIQKVKIEQMTKIFLTDFVEMAISNFIKKDLKMKFYNILLKNIPKTEIINFEHVLFYALNNMYGFKLNFKKSKKK
jgi:ATP sulfurylase